MESLVLGEGLSLVRNRISGSERKGSLFFEVHGLVELEGALQIFLWWPYRYHYKVCRTGGL